MFDKVMLQKAVLIYNSPNGLLLGGYPVYMRFVIECFLEI